jgi:hypothetical protein
MEKLLAARANQASLCELLLLRAGENLEERAIRVANLKTAPELLISESLDSKLALASWLLARALW